MSMYDEGSARAESALALPITEDEIHSMQEQIVAGAPIGITSRRPLTGATREIARLATANALLVLSAQFAIPLPTTPVPVVVTTLAITLIAVWLGASRAGVVLGMYLLEGAAGLPVFQPIGAPGVLRFVGPTGGYLMAYPIAAYVTGRLSAGWQRRPLWQTSIAVAAGHAVILAGGSAWLAQGLGMGWSYGLKAGAAPFVLGACVKTAIAVSLIGALRRPEGRRRDRDASD